MWPMVYVVPKIDYDIERSKLGNYWMWERYGA